MELLKQNHKNFDFVEVCKHIDDEELLDEDLIMIFQQAFTDMEKQRKKIMLEQNLAESNLQKIKLDEYLKAANVHFVVSEETKCGQCFTKISKYPFSFLPDSQTVIHTHHLM